MEYYGIAVTFMYMIHVQHADQHSATARSAALHEHGTPYNSLSPTQIRDSASLADFRRALKEELFRLSFG